MKKFIKKLAAPLCILVLCYLAYAIYHKLFYYTHNEIASFPHLSYAPSQQLDVPDGIWLHRVNSPERLAYFLNDYAGFEMDIYYDSSRNFFNVDHDNRDFNTTLRDMFNTLKKGEKTGKNVWVWLDFKNLDDGNKDMALAHLETLLAECPIPRDHIIVESSAIEALKPFHDKGYVTSFYFTPPSGPDWREQTEQLRERFYRSGSTAVSSHLANYDLVKAAFPNAPWLFWDMKSYNRSNVLTFIAARIRRKTLFRTPNVEVLLVGDRKMRR